MNEYKYQAERMQDGVAYFEDKSDECLPTNLRVGINAAMSDHSGLVVLLISKGIISEEEYFKAITASMRREADSYEGRIQESLSPNGETQEEKF